MMDEIAKAKLTEERRARFKSPAFTTPHGKALTLKQKTAIAEYIKTGVKSAAYRAAYKSNKDNVHQKANVFFKNPKIISALEKALKETKFDDQYAVSTLKKIVDGGMANIDITRPDTSLKALETYFKITNKIGVNKVAIKMDFEAQAKKMDMNELQHSLKELDKKQRRILAIIGGSEEGEIVHE